MIERSSADSRANNCLEDTLKETEPGKAFIKAYPQAAAAMLLEGHASHTGVHAAGLLVCTEAIHDYCSIDGDGVAQIDYRAADTLGLLKIDVLGLRTLGVLEDSGVGIDWYNLPFNDQATYDVFNSGRLCGIFQFEGNALRAISHEIDFKTITEIDAVTALARPGPFGGGVTEKYIKRRKGEPYASVHPLVEEHMKETFGLPVYQEQTLSIVREIGKFDWKETSTIRKAMSKRMGKEFFDTYWEKFKAGATSQGIPEKQARETWELINAMGAWQMNKCIAQGTLVRVASNGTGAAMWCPIEELYRKYVAEPSPWIRQNKSMPRLMSLFPDGSGRPQKAKAIFKNGRKPCVKLLFNDGSHVVCTADHRFLINGQWAVCATAAIGDEFTCLVRKRNFTTLRGNAAKGKHWNLPDGNDRRGENNVGFLNGFTKAKEDFRTAMVGKVCERCGCITKRMEVHHKDLNEGRDRPNDLAWLCSGCHKKIHHELGDRGKPFDAGHTQTTKFLVSVEGVGEVETYDIEMPEHHNYVVNDGLVTHNSHTYSYAVISYWTAYLKAHHPLEFAAANLRNAKDEDSARELLREMVREGTAYEPFDLTKSQLNWSAQDGKLYGGFLALKGVGESKAAKLIEARDAGKLTADQLKTIHEAENAFADLFPIHRLYGRFYEDPKSCNIIGKVVDIVELTEGIPHGEERVFIAELIHKNARDANEEVNVKKRGGKLETGPTDFVDVRLRDDTGMIGGRIGRFDFQRIGKELLENVPLGAHLLIRAKFWNGIRYAFVSKWKRLD